MHGHHAEIALDRLAGRLRAEAASMHGVPDALAAEAAGITMRRLADSIDPTIPADARRADSYFWGVVRRIALSGGRDTAEVRDRYLAAALAEDLACAGHGPERIFEELARRFGAALTQAMLDPRGPEATRSTGEAA